MNNKVIKDGIIHDSPLHKQYGIGCVLGPDNCLIDKNPITVYDDDTQNVHLVPQNEDALNKANVIISELRKSTLKLLEENIKMICNSYKICKKEEFYNTLNLKDDKWYVFGSNYETLKCSDVEYDFKNVFLYKYIALRKNGITYELNFMRFFIDEENRINCILGRPQFDRCIGNYVNRKGICYPHTPDSEKGQLKNIISVTETHFGMNNYCYNPNIENIKFQKNDKGNYIVEDGNEYLKSYAERLANEFIDFVKINEEYSGKYSEGAE